MSKSLFDEMCRTEGCLGKLARKIAERLENAAAMLGNMVACILNNVPGMAGSLVTLANGVNSTVGVAQAGIRAAQIGAMPALGAISSMLGNRD